MPLHRDIHWIGRQWAVTGHGMQLIDQKQKGFFDIETSRLWDEALIERTRAQDWIKLADFDKGLEVARKRHSTQPQAVVPPPEQMISSALVHAAKPAESPLQAPAMIEPAKPAPGTFDMRFLGNAKFIRPWRARMKT